MIELLIALVIVSVGVLAVARMQLQMVQFNQQALVRTQATNLAQDMLDRLRADRRGAQLGNYNLAMSSDEPTGGDLASRELLQWLNLLGSLPNGDGSVLVSGDAVEIVVRWEDSRSGDAAPVFVLVTEL